MFTVRTALGLLLVLVTIPALADPLCRIHLATGDLQKLLATFPEQVIKDDANQRLAVGNFALNKIADQQLHFDFTLTYQVWSPVPVVRLVEQKIWGRTIKRPKVRMERKRVINLAVRARATLSIILHCDRYLFRVRLTRVHAGIPDELQKLLCQILNSTLQRELFSLETRQSNLGGRIALSIGQSPQSGGENFSYLQPQPENFTHLVHSALAQQPPNYLAKYGLSYHRDYLRLNRPVVCPPATTVELEDNRFTFPSIVVDGQRLLLTSELFFRRLLVRCRQTEQAYPCGKVKITIPVAWDCASNYLGFKLADNDNQVQFLASPNPALDMIAAALNLSYKANLKAAISRWRIPKQRLQIKFSHNSRQHIFQFIKAQIIAERIFFCYRMQ